MNQKEIMQLQEIQDREKKLLGNYQQTHNVLLAEVCNVNLFILIFLLMSFRKKLVLIILIGAMLLEVNVIILAIKMNH